MAFPFAALFGAIGTAISGFFGFKGNQAETVKSALKVLSNATATDGQREQAIATIIAAEASSGYWLAAVWRPLLMVFFAILIGAFWFGYVPPNFGSEMPPALAEIFTIIKIGIAGYIPARSLEKIISNLNLSAVLKQFIQKKLG